MNTENAAVDLTEAESAAQAAHEAELKAAADAQAAAEAEAARLAAEQARANDPVEQARLAAEAERERLAAATADAERAAAEARAAAQQLAEQAAAQQAQQAQQPPRDFNAELAALESQYDEGDIDQATFRTRERELIRAQAEADLRREADERRRADEEAARARAETDAAAQWQQAQEQFFADPTNAALIGNKIKMAAFEAAVQEAVGHLQAGATYTDVLVKARELVTGVAAVDPKAAERDAAARRQIDEPGATQTLRDVPSAAATGDVPGASLDNLDIGDLEDRLARMSDADREAYLAGAPGGLRDNRRAVD